VGILFIFTSVPPVIYAGLERDVGKEAILACPMLYWWDGKRANMIGIRHFFYALGLGVVHSFICFFIPYLGMRPYIDHHARGINLTTFGVTVYAVVVLTVNLRIATMCHFWTWLHHVFIWGSIAIYPIVVSVISLMPIDLNIYQTGYLAFGTTSFWLSILAATLYTIFPVILLETWRTGQDRMVNRVVHWQHRKEAYEKEGIKLEDVVKEFIPVEPVPRRDNYIDPTNQTGSIMDAPEQQQQSVSTLRLRTRTLTRGPSAFPKVSTFVVPDG
jgi:magnesium-transporting ATPase (P-type)